MNNPNTFVELSPLGIIKVAGLEAEKFLQGQLTCDVREVTAQQSCLGAHCDHKGRVQATFRLFKYRDDYYLQIAKNLIEHLLNVLKKYAVFSKVTLTDVSQDWQQMGISGADCATILNQFIADTAPTNIDEIKCLNNLIIIRLPDDLPRFCLLGLDHDMAALKQHLLTQCQTKDFTYWQLLDIKNGIPTLFPSTIGLFTPQQINYTAINGVSFNKGCYTGQEIIARTHYLGKAKQHLYKITFTSENPVVPGTPLITTTHEQTQECGTLVQAVLIQANQWQGLAVIFDTAIGQTLYIGNLLQPILDVQDLPYTIDK